ncbi:hypothetical protein BCR37DRAFT_396230 [Protomyces lactucae-debilis]|uniref:Uncharacterized protein n=1 Tax=Protomyces lactucae-debilis TaxID=2754530 RepID=A0A1Y2FX99_PROLT|nr:uncharacterized protein BCR37DRAFT_396230 [Protomyces lactucae-debilis]ORY87806.1 hypothetical protein BCR37DRAFT_396230 [Protomyces lactucae-debilis]
MSGESQNDTIGAWGTSNFSRETIIQSFVVILKGRHRYCKAQFMWHRRKQCVYGIAKGNGLQELLKRRFGHDAEGLLIDGEIWFDDEEILRGGVFETGKSYYVVYNDNVPSYSEAKALPPAYDLPEASRRDREVHRIHGYSYYTSIPTLTKELNIGLGKTSKALVMTNKDTKHIDTLINFLSSYANDRWVGVLCHGREYIDDSILYDEAAVPDETYPVTYRSPGKLNVFQKLSDKARALNYSTAALT